MGVTSPAKAEPRISVNKLGEYLDASVTRRRAIVKDQKRPPGAGVVSRYSHVNTALLEYFQDSDKKFLADRVQKLKADISGSEWQREDRLLSAEVLEKLIGMLDEIDLTGVSVEAFSPKTQSTIFIGGVRVSVRPDFLIKSEIGEVVGAIKLSHNKQHPLQQAACESVAMLLWKYLKDVFPAAPVELKRCVAISTPVKRVVSAPKAHKVRLDAIEAACEEIAARWPAIH